MKSKEFVDKAKELASHKTMYIKDCPGVYMTQANKLRYSSNNSFNSQRSGMIFGATEDTFGLDSIGMINTLTGNGFKNFADVATFTSDISKDFSNLEEGELVFTSDSVGIYIGGSEVIAVTPIGVSKVSIGGWKSHGKLNGIDYSFREEVKEEIPETEDTTEVKEVPTNVEKGRVEVRPDRARRRH